MWYGLRMSDRTDPDLLSAVSELLQMTSRILILATGGVYLAWYFLGMEGRGKLAVRLAPITMVVVLASSLALWLLSRRLLLAQAIWQAGLAAAIALAMYVSRVPEVAFLYVLLPLLTTVTVNWLGGLLAEGVVIALLWWASRSSFMPTLPFGYGVAIVIGGGFTGLLGWGVTHSLLTVTQWSIFSFGQARQKVEEARDQRLELRQIQEDLIHANRELARLSDRLKAMYQVAEEARQAKAEFVANVSHELRTPLNMIIGFSEMIPRSSRVYQVRLPPPLLSDIAAIHRNSQHLARLVDDVLDLSQVEAGRVALSKEWASLQEIVEEAIQVVRPLFESKGLYLETDIPAEVSPLFCDGTRIRQVVINLLSNAGRFTDRGGVRISVEPRQDDIVIGVADTGPGIPLADQERVFEPFQQLDGSIRRRHGGSGLGLSISRRFVEMHGGKMWLQSEVGVGTTLTFCLPSSPPLNTALDGDDVMRWFSPYHQHETRTRRSKAPVPTTVPRFVLLEQGETLKRLFERYLDDVELVSARDADEAIHELGHSPAQALVVNAPGLITAPTLLDRLGDLPWNTPAVACWVPGEDETAKQLGVIHYLIKPIAVETLLSTLESLQASTVLLVDDQPEALQLFTRMLALADRGYRVLQATNGHRALALLRERQPDVMLLDLVMPGMDGFQVLREKSQDATIRDIPVVVVTSRDPSGEPIVSDTLTVARGDGLSVRDLLSCIQAVSEILAPQGSSDGRGRPERPAV
jgi:signal transduction histidine kinase/CheY-like chemotaxis protein